MWIDLTLFLMSVSTFRYLIAYFVVCFGVIVANLISLVSCATCKWLIFSELRKILDINQLNCKVDFTVSQWHTNKVQNERFTRITDIYTPLLLLKIKQLQGGALPPLHCTQPNGKRWKGVEGYRGRGGYFARVTFKFFFLFFHKKR